jgi:single-strand DNA-binding protein
MAGSMNRVTLIGNLGADPEIRTAGSGDKCANLRIATTEKWTVKDTGEKREATEWHSITIWVQGLVRVVESYAKKGSKVLVEGQLKTRKWQDQSGQDRYTTEVVLQGRDSKFLLLGESAGRKGPPPADNPPDGYDPTGSGGGYGGNQGGPAPSRDMDDEIPF